ncbi:unnamed protein product, partial [Symbiodinium microadriaticum]
YRSAREPVEGSRCLRDRARRHREGSGWYRRKAALRRHPPSGQPHCERVDAYRRADAYCQIPGGGQQPLQDYGQAQQGVRWHSCTRIDGTCGGEGDAILHKRRCTDDARSVGPDGAIPCICEVQ